MQQTLHQLSDYLETIFFCITKGFNRASAFLATSETTLDKTTRANIIRDHVVDEIKASFPRDLWFRNQSRLFGLLINGHLIRFKKIDEKRLARNIPTRQARNFGAQIPLPGVSATINLNAGWHLDKSETLLETVYLAKPRSMNENNWVLNLGEYLRDTNSIHAIPLLTGFPVEPPQAEPIDTPIKPEALAKRLREKIQNE